MMWLPTVAILAAGSVAFIVLDRIFKGFKGHDPETCPECQSGERYDTYEDAFQAAFANIPDLRQWVQELIRATRRYEDAKRAYCENPFSQFRVDAFGDARQALDDLTYAPTRAARTYPKALDVRPARYDTIE